MTTNLPAVLHTVSGAVVIASATILLGLGKIDPAAGVALIAASGGLTLGAGAVSIGAGQQAPTTSTGTTGSSGGTAPTP